MNTRKTLLTAFAALAATAGAAQATEIMVPLYAWPSAWTDAYDDCDDIVDANVRAACIQGKPQWARWQAVAATCSEGNVPVTVIVNPNDGPGLLADGDPCLTPGSDWQEGLDLLDASGCHVLGYVETDYLERDMGAMWTEMQAYLNACPETGRIDGFFFDEYKGFQVTAADVELTATWTWVASFFGRDVVINPGTPPQWDPDEAPAGAEGSNPYDSLNMEGHPLRAMITVENTPDGYANVNLPQWQQDGDPSDYALLLHGVDQSDPEAMLELMNEAWRDGFGHVFMTQATGADPWGAQSTFWDDLVGKSQSLTAYGDWSDEDAVNAYCYGAPNGPFYPGQCAGGQQVMPGLCVVADPYSPYYATGGMCFAF